MAVISNPVEFAVAVEIAFNTPLLIWTGSETQTGSLTFGSPPKAYAHGGVLDVSTADVSKASTNDSLTLSLAAFQAIDRTRYFGADPGPRDVILRSLWREQESGVWTAWQEAFSSTGALSQVSEQDGTLTVEVAHVLDDVDRGVVQYLSDSEQRKRYPDPVPDEGLYMLASAGGSVINLAWPA